MVVWHCLPGHEACTQNAVSEKIPLQSSPPCKGVGDVQLRILLLFAVPHVALHAPYSLQEDQPPLTIKTSKNWDLHSVVVTGFMPILRLRVITSISDVYLGMDVEYKLWFLRADHRNPTHLSKGVARSKSLFLILTLFHRSPYMVYNYSIPTRIHQLKFNIFVNSVKIMVEI